MAHRKLCITLQEQLADRLDAYCESHYCDRSSALAHFTVEGLNAVEGQEELLKGLSRMAYNFDLLIQKFPELRRDLTLEEARDLSNLEEMLRNPRAYVKHLPRS